MATEAGRSVVTSLSLHPSVCVCVWFASQVNVGDVMQIWSNDRYPAALHRVKANPSRERYSIPFFFFPQYDAVIAPLTAGQPPRYRPFRWGEFRADRIKGDYADLGEEAQVDRYRRTEA